VSLGTAYRAGVVKDLRRRARDPWAMMAWLALPLLIGGLITFITSGGSGGGTPSIPLLVTNHDDSFLSRFLMGALDAGPETGMLEVTVVEEEEGRARVTAGDASALLVIPAGFGAAVLKEEPATLQLWTNPAERIRPQIVETGLDLLAESHFYLHRIFGEELHTLSASLEGDGPPESALVAALGAAINDKIQDLSPFLSEDLITVEPPPPEASEEEAEDAPSFALLFFPGVVMMSLLFVAQGLSEEWWRERELGTLRRIKTSPLGLRAFLPAKVTAAVVLFLLLTGSLLALGFAYHALPWSRFPVALLWSLLAGVLFYLALSAIQLHTPTRRSGALLTQLLIFPLMMVGGSFFPLEALPTFLARVGAWTPNGFVGERLKGYLLGDYGSEALALPALVLAAVAGLLFLWTARRNARVFAAVA
jgi:ABC-type multidrug transport system permease subunit